MAIKIENLLLSAGHQSDWSVKSAVKTEYNIKKKKKKKKKRFGHLNFVVVVADHQPDSK